MLRKAAWVMTLLVMTISTIFFKDGAQIVMGNLSPNPLSSEGTNNSMEGFSNQSGTKNPRHQSGSGFGVYVPVAGLAATPTIEAQYLLQPGAPLYLDNFAHPDEGCNWQGIAGQVFDQKGEPVTNLVVKISGVWNGNVISKIGITGMAAGLEYGPGGYEIVLGKQAVDSNSPLAIQVFNSAQEPLTEPRYIVTKAGCVENLMIVNFISY
ncbi:MAG: hypothetical protein KBD67_01690 [Anaerolineaceae bacterium]|nr:hypothetical protein [Anaerolineaceae bacterium]